MQGGGSAELGVSAARLTSWLLVFEIGFRPQIEQLGLAAGHPCRASGTRPAEPITLRQASVSSKASALGRTTLPAANRTCTYH